MKSFLKKSKFVVHFYESLKFLYGAFNWRYNSNIVDRNCPFDGPLGALGFYGYSLNSSELVSLKTKAVGSIENPLRLYSTDFTWLLDFFDKLKPIIMSYLGETAKLDGINWFVTNPGEDNISSNWHTDNVGTRLKVFVCVEGDGTIPTILMPSTERIPSTLSWIRNVMIELLRWSGVSSKFRVGKSKSCEHKDGTVYIFDTQLLHRGGYEIGFNKRVIFHLEFSVPEKHKLLKGPIGTSEHNRFYFHKDLLKIDSLNSLIDLDRANMSDDQGEFFYYYSN
jgi:hypothetical protein